MKFDDRKDITKIYGILRSLTFTILVLLILQRCLMFELKFVLKDEIWAVIFLKDEI